MKYSPPVPCVYHKRGAANFVGPTLATFGAWMFNSSLSDPISWRGLPPSFWRIDFFVIMLWGIVATISTYSTKITVTADSIEIGNVFGRRKISFDAIRGRRCYMSGRGKLTAINFKLELKDSKLPALTFQGDFNFDDNFWLWFDQLPDLDVGKK